MSETKIKLDDYIDDLPLAVASYRQKLKYEIMLLCKDVLELAAENAQTITILRTPFSYRGCDTIINKESILNTINQIE